MRNEYMNGIQILNIKFPFIEAVDYLKNDEDVIACVCINNDRPCIITLNEVHELRVIENNLFEDFNSSLIDRLLTLDNILLDEWNLIIKTKMVL